MERIRNLKKVIRSTPTLEGAGVHLKRAFGFQHKLQFDPFLLLDDFHSDNPADYMMGFPWHPHRGIETITYLINGSVEHGDSLGNKGVINSGDVQWMTAGSGIIHQEMPKGREDGLMRGLQLWANLPSSHKMMKPRYRDIKSSQIPRLVMENDITVRIISGEVNGIKGPVNDIVIDPLFLDITIPEDLSFTYNVHPDYTLFAYVLEGDGYFDDKREYRVKNDTLVLFDDGDTIKIEAGKNTLRFILLSGKPINEPVAWYGPIVMNTQEELQQAFEEYQNGTFLKHKTID